MISSFRLFLFVWLVLLQCVAPLVHAHAGESRIKIGLHVPGLEIYGAATAALKGETVVAYASSDSILFGVDTGIKQSQNSPSTDTQNSPYLHQAMMGGIPPLKAFNFQFSPQAPPAAGCLSSPSHAPRAPPAQS